MRSMKNYIITAIGVLGIVSQSYAGNPQRAGSAGASELLINPYARSSGWGDVSLGGVRGSDAMFVNIAGLSFVEGTEIRFDNTQWLVGAGVQINSLSFIQRVGDNGVFGIGIVGFDYGEWEITTADQPGGNGAIIAPSALIINIGYSQKFTESIFGGINIKTFNSQISNMKSMGLMFDAGVQYIPEGNDEWKFGITLQNIGPSLKYTGDGSSVILPVPTNGTAYSQAWDGKSAKFELPTKLSMGISRDFNLDEEHNHRITGAVAFTSNSFEADFFQLGGEYGFKGVFMVRLGYKVFLTSSEDLKSALTGLTAGFTAQLPLNKSKGTFLGIDYSYRATNPFQGVHSVGIAIGL